MGLKGFRSWFESQFPDAITDMPRVDGPNNRNNNEEFDHVLIDMNQLLHIVLRKSRSNGHCFTLLMQELDACIALATPTQSLVLAMDGSPGAAKLATQRRRRFHTVRKADTKVAQLDKLLESATAKQQQSGRSSSNAMSKRMQKSVRTWTRKKRQALAEVRTLCITPGTEFMHQAEQAILYWAWQRLAARQTPLIGVKIFVSSSLVPGEGEVKLLEWMYAKERRRGESVAILGGDSDLILEALVVPVASTHNIFVLLPEGNKRFWSVSLWETTRSLFRYLSTPTTAAALSSQNTSNTPSLTMEFVMPLRTDLVLLLILNGNDYLPKLRGSSGFNKLFHSYCRLQREWPMNATSAKRPTLLDADLLQFKLDFCIAYFSRLAAMTPANMLRRGSAVAAVTAMPNNSAASTTTTPLQQLHIMLDGGFLPKPIRFMVIDDDDENIHEPIEVTNDDEDDASSSKESEDEDDDDSDSNSGLESVEEDQVKVRLQLGEPGSEDYIVYEIRHIRGMAMKKAKHRLAAMAISDFMDDEVEVDDEEEEEDAANENGSIPGNAKGYDWEVNQVVEGNVERYLYGLLWNVQTYQDGVCADYSFNYGKRMAPPAKDIVTFLKLALAENRTVGLTNLCPVKGLISPVSAGLSCLAALPSPVKHLVPEPYRWLPDVTVEEFYASCMDPEDNVFDIKRFELLCEDKLRSIKLPAKGRNEDLTAPIDQSETKADHFWTVVSKVSKPLAKPCAPPEPFSDRHSKLKPNDKIRISQFLACAEPRHRMFNAQGDTGTHIESKRVDKQEIQKYHSDPGPFLGQFGSILEVDYRIAFKKKKERKGIRKGTVKLTLKSCDENDVTGEASSNKSYNNATLTNATTNSSINGSDEHAAVARDDPTNIMPSTTDYTKRNGFETPLYQPLKNLDGETAMAVLKQLSDLELIGPIQVSPTFLNCRNV